jgi:uncharacterized membrane protein
MKTLTAGIFTGHMDAERAIEELKQLGVSSSDISCVYRNAEGEIEDAESGTKTGVGAAEGAAAGAVVGAIAGLVVANGILPGLGTLFVAGPLAAALGFTGAAATTVAGAATGAVAGGLIGALTHLGIKQEDAEMYETHVRSGDTLVIAQTDTPGISDILARNGAIAIREYADI